MDALDIATYDIISQKYRILYSAYRSHPSKEIEAQLGMLYSMKETFLNRVICHLERCLGC